MSAGRLPNPATPRGRIRGSESTWTLSVVGPGASNRPQTGMALALLISMAMHGFAAVLLPRDEPAREPIQGALLSIELVAVRFNNPQPAAPSDQTLASDPEQPPAIAAPLPRQDEENPLDLPRQPTNQSSSGSRSLSPPVPQPRRSPDKNQPHHPKPQSPTAPPKTAVTAKTIPNQGGATPRGSAVPSSGPDTAPLNPGAEDERAYLRALVAAIARQQQYPEEARHLGQTGQVVVAFVIQADGRFQSIRMVQGSGHAQLDQAALAAIQRLGRFAPIPPSLNRSIWSVQVPIRFKLD